MTIKIRLTNIIILAIILAIAISFTGTSVTFARENTEYYSDSSSTFSPGYLNAAKFEAEAIVRQQTPSNKGLFKEVVSGVTDFVQSTIGALIGKEKNEKTEVAPVLQRKMSNPKGKSALPNAITILNPAPIPDNVMNSINAAYGLSLSDDQVTFLNGKYYAVWNDGSGSNKLMIFDSNGTALPGMTPKTINEDFNSMDGYIKVFANDSNISVFWFDGSGLQCQILDSSGNTIQQYDGSTTTTLWSGNIGPYSINTAGLSNGDIAVVWIGGSGEDESSYTPMFQLLESKGNPIFTTPPILNIDLSSGNINQIINDSTEACLEAIKEHQISITASGDVYINNINTLSDGGVTVSWNETGGSGSADLLKSPYSKDIYGYYNNPNADPNSLTHLKAK